MRLHSSTLAAADYRFLFGSALFSLPTEATTTTTTTTTLQSFV